jgi:hypothetical protein
MAKQEQALGAFGYTPLPSADYIRLLRLDGEDSTSELDGITASLEVYKLDSSPPYTTLSYSWGRNKDGDASLSHQVYINGRAVPVTENLFDGLVQLLRRLDKKLTHPLFWVDALCINQGDNQERSAQVAVMGKIYSHAGDMAVWLGEDRETEDDKLAFEALSVFQDCNFQDADFSKWQENACALTATDTKAQAASLMKFAYFGQYSRSYNEHKEHAWNLLNHSIYKLLRQGIKAILTMWHRAVDNVLRRRYFKRRWIVQEIYHANPSCISVFWGGYDMTSVEMLHLGECLNRALHKLESEVSDFALPQRGSFESHLLWLHDLFDKYVVDVEAGALRGQVRQILKSTHSDWQELSYRLHSCSDMDCADPRDRAYAFHSILEDPNTFPPNYNLRVEAVYSRLAAWLVERGALHQVLGDASFQHPCLRNSCSELPSWVPDLRLSLNTYDQRSLPTVSGKVFSFSPDGNAIFLRGAMVGLQSVQNLLPDITMGWQQGDVRCLMEYVYDAHFNRYAIHVLRRTELEATNTAVDNDLVGWGLCRSSCKAYRLVGRHVIDAADMRRLFGYSPMFETIAIV